MIICIQVRVLNECSTDSIERLWATLAELGSRLSPPEVRGAARSACVLSASLTRDCATLLAQSSSGFDQLVNAGSH